MRDIFSVISCNYSTFDEYLNEINKVDDINIKGTCTECSLLQEAICNEKKDIACDLIKRGIDVNIQDKNGNTALSYLVNRIDINLELIKAILDNGADVNLKDNYGNTVFYKAICRGAECEELYDFLNLLIEKGADLSIKNGKKGLTALDVSKIVNRKKITDMLENMGCESDNNVIKSILEDDGSNVEKEVNPFDKLVRQAKKGDSDAQCSLGDMYARGDEVEHDFKQAIKWINYLQNKEIWLLRNEWDICINMQKVYEKMLIKLLNFTKCLHSKDIH